MASMLSRLPGSRIGGLVGGRHGGRRPGGGGRPEGIKLGISGNSVVVPSVCLFVCLFFF